MSGGWRVVRMTARCDLALLACAFVFSGFTAAVAATSAPSAAPRALAGVWWTQSDSGKALPMDGGAVPLNATGEQAYRKVSADIAAGKIVDPAAGLCIPEGFPRTSIAPVPFEIFESPEQITFVYEDNSGFRQVPLTGSHIAARDIIPSFRGRAIGRWDGDTFVVDSIGYNAHTWLDDSGLPHGEKLHLIERFRKIDGGKNLENLITIEDPDFYTKPWTVRMVYEWSPNVQIEDFSCGENRPHVRIRH